MEAHREKVLAGMKRYREENHEKVSEWKKQWYSEHREAVLAQHRQYRAENRDAIAKQRQQHYLENREEIAERARRHRKVNRKAIRAAKKRYYIENREKIWEYQERYRAENREKVAEHKRRWELANPERARENGRRSAGVRRARKRATQVVNFTQEQFEQKMAYYGNSCYLKLDCCTGGFDEVEHVKPLSKGGPHMIANFRPACTPCNRRKYNQWPFEPAA